MRLDPLKGSLLAAVLAGCSIGTPPSGNDAGLPDAGGGADAGAMDSGAPDSGPVDAGPTATLSFTWHRDDGGSSAIDVLVSAVDGQGQAVAGLQVQVDSAGTSQTAVPGDGGYLATVIPPFQSGELPVTVHLAGSDAGVTRTALVLPSLAPWWDQPETLPAPVNTPGTEDSSTVSSDGQWLIVASYAPVDLLCCSTGCGGWDSLDGDSPFCGDVLGPIAAPERPGMPGADRAVASGIVDDDPTVCAVGTDGGVVLVPGADGGVHPFALPPVGAFLFHRQTDGTFAEPHVIDVGADGFLGAPACFTFLGTADAGENVSVIFGYGVFRHDAKPHPWFGRLTLGADNTLSNYGCPPGATVPAFAPSEMVPVPVGPVGQQAINTTVALTGAGAYLLSDDESATPPYVEWSQALPDGGFTDWQPMALPDPTADRRQPNYVGGRLYYYRDGQIVSVAWDGSAPSSLSSFSAQAVEAASAAPEGRVGEVIAVGQPTFAQPPGGSVEMYFVYYRSTATGFDGQIARVPLR